MPVPASGPRAVQVLGTRHSPGPALPDGACDTHLHLFGPAGRYPYATDRGYLPPDALPAGLRALHRHLDITRTVLVQPSPYGTDNIRLLDGLRTLGDPARGIAVVSPGTAPDRAGVRGVRVSLGTHATNDLDRAREHIHATATTIAPLGRHVDLHLDTAALAAFEDRLPPAPVPVVLDHFAGYRAQIPSGTGTPARALRLPATGRVRVKLSAPYRVTDCGDHDALAPALAALLDARADRALWGSDWPHTGGSPASRRPDRVQPYLSVDDGLSSTRFAEPLDPSDLRRVLVDNPARLYRR
ncbi:amidohydrolase family protein [Streptomyces sp. NPDC005009]